MVVKIKYKIEKNIPLPEQDGRRERPKTDLRLTMEQMEVGDSILLYDWQNERTKVDRICGSIGFAYTTRKIDPINYNRVRMWRTK